jgi:A/G-specific adenine glycosylase
VNDEQIIQLVFGRELLRWYRKERRDLPWRRTRDPYSIWVSEIMLQQTRVDTVIPYYHRFFDRFPTVLDLAEAPEEDVLKHWEGLGYYSRARNLQAGAKEVVDRFGGQVPKEKKDVFGLKGVGPYTAGAILSIAFGQPEPAVDGNVMRVLSRHFLIEDDIARPATRAPMERLARELIPEGEAADFNQALMELGAMVCTPKSPSCDNCPVSEHCAAKRENRVKDLPVKSKAKPPKPEYRLAALIEGTGDNVGKVLVRRRADQGLLARMWELPHLEAPSLATWESPNKGGAYLADLLAAEGIELVHPQHLADEQHIFTHLIWHVRVLRATGSVPAFDERSDYVWVGPEQFENYAWPNVFRKILTDYFIEYTRVS